MIEPTNAEMLEAYEDLPKCGCGCTILPGGCSQEKCLHPELSWKHRAEVERLTRERDEATRAFHSLWSVSGDCLKAAKEPDRNPWIGEEPWKRHVREMAEIEKGALGIALARAEKAERERDEWKDEAELKGAAHRGAVEAHKRAEDRVAALEAALRGCAKQIGCSCCEMHPDGECGDCCFERERARALLAPAEEARAEERAWPRYCPDADLASEARQLYEYAVTTDRADAEESIRASLEEVARRSVEEEREACARVADDGRTVVSGISQQADTTARMIAAAIRARKP